MWLCRLLARELEFRFWSFRRWCLSDVMVVVMLRGAVAARCGSMGDSERFLPRGMLATVVSGLSPLVHGRFSADPLSVVPLALPLPLLARLSIRRLCQELFA